MRRILLVLSIIFFDNFLFAQDTSQTTFGNTIVKIDLVYPAIGILSPEFSNMFSMSLENTTTKNQSIQLSGKYNTFTFTQINQHSFYGTNFSTKSKTILKTMQLIPEYRFYIAKKKFYLGPYLKYSYSHDKTETIPNDTIVQVIQNGLFDIVFYTAGFGGIVGYQFFIMNHFSVDFLLGLGARKIIYKKINQGQGDVKSSLADGFFSINLGYRFFYKKGK